MPKYTTDIVAGYCLYFTTKCIVEAMHVHASDKDLTENASAKLFVKSNGDTVIKRYGQVNEIDMCRIQRYIKNNHKTMYKKWERYSDNGYYEGS